MNEQHDEQLDKMIDRVKQKLSEKEEKELVGFWIPKSIKEKYDKAQVATKKELGKEIQDLITRAIKRVNLEEFEACG